MIRRDVQQPVPTAHMREQFRILEESSAKPLQKGDQLPAQTIEAFVRSVGGYSETRDLSKALRNARFQVVDDAAVPHGADAYYDVRDGTVKVPKSLITDMVSAAKRQAEMRVNLQDRRKHRSPTYTFSGAEMQEFQNTRRRVGTALALLAHEAEHDAQRGSGELRRHLVHGDVSNDGKLGPKEYLAAVELPAQRRQEHVQFALNLPPKHSTWLTLNENGEDLSNKESVANLYREFGHDLEKRGHVTQLPERTVFDEDFPGQNLFGDDLSQFSGSDSKQPGRKFFGEELPGRKFFGDELPGRKFFGGELPGRKFFGRRD